MASEEGRQCWKVSSPGLLSAPQAVWLPLAGCWGSWLVFSGKRFFTATKQAVTRPHGTRESLLVSRWTQRSVPHCRIKARSTGVRVRRTEGSTVIRSGLGLSSSPVLCPGCVAGTGNNWASPQVHPSAGVQAELGKASRKLERVALSSVPSTDRASHCAQ